MAKIITLLILVYLADVNSTKTILQDIKEHAVELRKNFSTNPFWQEADRKLFYSDPCMPYVPLVADVTNLKTVSEIKCKEYMWYLKNQLLEKNQLQRCEANKAYLKYRSEEHNVTSGSGDGYVGFGRAAEYAEFPHMGAVGWRCKDTAKEWVFKCGSSLISKKFLLTAAHCTKISPRYVTDIVNSKPEVVKLGVENILDTVGTDERRAKIVKILNIIVHPEYQSPKKYNDIALLEVEDAIEFNEFIKPACVWPHKDITLLGEKVYLTGWGETESGKFPTRLQAGEVEILDTATCDDALKPFHNRNWNGFTDKQMCAGKPGGRVDTCQGDSGGPLCLRLDPYDYAEESLHLVIGITSFGIKCSVKDRPGVYTRVASYIDWIEEQVWNTTSKRIIL